MKTKYGQDINPDDFPYYGQFGNYVRQNIDSEWGMGKEREITKKRRLRGLLKECKNIVAHDCWQEAQFPDGQVVERQDLLTRINAALGESEEHSNMLKNADNFNTSGGNVKENNI